MYPSAGKLRLKIEAGRAVGGEESDTNFNDSNSDVDVKVRYITNDDIIGKISLKDEGLSKSYNTVSASISAPELNFDDRSISFLDSTYKKQDNGIVKSANFSMPGITNYYNARIAAKQTLDRSRFSRQISFTMRPSGMAILPGQLIRINYPRFGWGTGSEVIFRVRTVSISKDCLVSITASEYNDSIYVIDKNITSPFFIDEPVKQVSRTPGVPGNVSVATATTASPNIVTWTAAAEHISEDTGYYEIWRATSFSGDAGVSVVSHASLVGEVPAKELVFTDIGTSSTSSQEFIYWVRAYNQSAPQTTSGVKRGFRRYYGAFNDDSDYGGVGQAAAAKAQLKAVEESITIRFGRGNTVVIPADSSGNVSDYSVGGAPIRVFIGNTDVTGQVTSFVISNATNISGNISGTNYTVSNMTADTASLRITANIPANVTTGLAVATSVFGDISFSKAREGADGTDGVDAYTVRGSNESHTFVADTTGAASMIGFSCDFTVFKGAQAYTYDGSSPYDSNSFRYGTIVATNVTQSVSGTGQITLQSGSAIATGLSTVTGALSVPIIDNATGTTVALPLISFSKSIQAARDGGVFIFEESTTSAISATNASEFAQTTATTAAVQAAAAAVIASSSDGHIRPNDRVTVSDISADLAGTRIYTGTGTASSSSVSTSDFSALVTEVFDGSVIVDGTLSADKLLANTTTTNTLNIGSDLVVANNGKIHSVNKTGYSDTDAGFFLGWDGSNHAVNIGNATNFLKWNGTSLEVSGTLNITSSQINSALGYTPIAGSDVNANVTSISGGAITTGTVAANRIDVGSIVIGDLSGSSTFKGALTNVNNPTSALTPIAGSDVNANVTSISGGVITTGTVAAARVDVSGIITAGSIIVSGDNITSLTNNAGFTDDTAADAAQATADSKVAPSEVNGNVTSISGGVISTGVINLGNASGMAIRQGKTGYSSTTNGFWLGNDAGTPKFNIGDASDFMRWTGSQLEISGIVTAQAGSTIALLGISYPDILRKKTAVL